MSKNNTHIIVKIITRNNTLYTYLKKKYSRQSLYTLTFRIYRHRFFKGILQKKKETSRTYFSKYINVHKITFMKDYFITHRIKFMTSLKTNCFIN